MGRSRLPRGHSTLTLSCKNNPPIGPTAPVVGCTSAGGHVFPAVFFSHPCLRSPRIDRVLAVAKRGFASLGFVTAPARAAFPQLFFSAFREPREPLGFCQATNPRPGSVPQKEAPCDPLDHSSSSPPGCPLSAVTASPSAVAGRIRAHRHLPHDPALLIQDIPSSNSRFSPIGRSTEPRQLRRPRQLG